MKNLFLTLVCVAAVASASVAQAALVSVVETPTASGIAYAISVDDSGIGDYNSISVEIFPNAPDSFLNHDADGVNGSTILTAGTDFSFTNALLAYPGAFGGFGWSVPTSQNTAQGYVYGAGPLGSNIDASGPIFLNNVVLPVGATGVATIRLQSAGNDLFAATVQLGGAIIPEPGTLAMAGMSLIGLAFRRRNG